MPFLFMSPASIDREWDFLAAFAAAAAAEQADPERRNTLGRVCFLLCELGSQFGRRTGDYSAPLPLGRAELARAMGLGLARIKRILALLSLSQVITLDEEAIRIVDWRRLSAAAGYHPERLGVSLVDEDDGAAVREKEEPQTALTAAGDPACFV
ncbi:helix-turn-helix domain-containing protein [Sphingosinicella sp. CPCC 101087]|uniref:helix-turn-helix domain-containing protein n=1 Tax=Sphingosinicella sp. CPCC 101087 TaxID=2497754 RepID=UPI00197FB967|nr:helix-turn-helix domain-containing protein [Sphingosinicella sp. CPCC 101087]